MSKETAVPDGYMRDARGRLIPVDLVKPIDLERDRLVLELVGKARELSAGLASFKRNAFGDVGAFVELSTEQYGVKAGGTKGNLSLFSFDGRYKLQVAHADQLVFDERLQAAKTLIDECIREWAKDSGAEIRLLVQDAFQTDKAGKINTARVLGLRRLAIDNPKWQQAMTAISESLQVVGSRSYIRFYERVGSSDEYRHLSLDLGSAA
jgi:hypothetical protein